MYWLLAQCTLGVIVTSLQLVAGARSASHYVTSSGRAATMARHEITDQRIHDFETALRSHDFDDGCPKEILELDIFALHTDALFHGLHCDIIEYVLYCIGEAPTKGHFQLFTPEDVSAIMEEKCSAEQLFLLSQNTQEMTPNALAELTFEFFLHDGGYRKDEGHLPFFAEHDRHKKVLPYLSVGILQESSEKILEIIGPDQKFMSAEWFGEIFSSPEDYCEYVTGSVLSELSSELAQTMPADCFALLRGLDETTVGRRIRYYDEGIFSKINQPLHPSFYERATAPQITNLGVGVEEDQCQHVALSYIPAHKMHAVSKDCFLGYFSSEEVRSPIGPHVFRLPVDILADVTADHLSHIRCEDLRHFSIAQMRQLGAKDPEILTGWPDGCRIVDTKFVPNKDQMLHMTPRQRIELINTRSGNLDPDSFAKLTENDVDSDFFNALNASKNRRLIETLGTEVAKAEEHPCRAFSQKGELFRLSFLAKHIGPSCVAALDFLGDLTPKEYLALPPHAMADLPMAKIKELAGTNYLAAADEATLAGLAAGKTLCAELDIETFRSMTSRRALPASCVAKLTILAELTQADIQSLGDSAFREFDATSAGKIGSLAWLSPKQLAQLGAAVVEAERNAGAAFAEAAINELNAEQINAIDARILGAIPAKSFAAFNSTQIKAFNPTSLRSITYDQVRAINPKTFAGFEAKHWAQFGDSKPLGDPKHPAAAISDEQLSALSKDSNAAYKAKFSAGNAAAALTNNFAVLVITLMAGLFLCTF